MKDMQGDFNSQSPNPNLEAFNRKVRDLGINPDDQNLNIQYMLKAYMEGQQPDAEKLLPSV